MSYTNRARVALLLAPVILPVALVWNVPHALKRAVGEFWWSADFGGVLRDFYRNVYRVARYGSVHDG